MLNTYLYLSCIWLSYIFILCLKLLLRYFRTDFINVFRTRVCSNLDFSPCRSRMFISPARTSCFSTLQPRPLKLLLINSLARWTAVLKEACVNAAGKLVIIVSKQPSEKSRRNSQTEVSSCLSSGCIQCFSDEERSARFGRFQSENYCLFSLREHRFNSSPVFTSPSPKVFTSSSPEKGIHQFITPLNSDSWKKFLWGLQIPGQISTKPPCMLLWSRRTLIDATGKQ